MTGSNKIFVVDGTITMRFAVAAPDEDGAKEKAQKLVNKAMNTEFFNIVERNFDIKRVKEINTSNYIPGVRLINFNKAQQK